MLDSTTDLSEKPLVVVSTCRARDLPVLSLTAGKLPQMVPLKALYVVAPQSDCRLMERRLGNNVCVIPEDEFIPGMTLQELRKAQVPGFPAGAGWYFQQFLKLQFAFLETDEDYYLVWDADTVPLRPMRFFDREGRMLLTRATEYHTPYFATYRNMFGHDANRECSFVAQHMVIQKSVAREMLSLIESRIPGEGSWAWKIVQALPRTGVNLFSEYETYGHFIKNAYPERVLVIDRSWQREMTQRSVRAVPTPSELSEYAKCFDYVAFERAYAGWRRAAVWIKRSLRFASF